MAHPVRTVRCGGARGWPTRIKMSQSRRILITAISGWITLAAGCSGESAPMLHRLPSYAGTIRITPEGGTLVSYDLAFHRANGNLQAKRTIGNRVVTLVRGADGGASAFEDANERAATKDEVAQFELVRDLTDIRALDSLRRGETSYSVQRRGIWYAIELESQTGTPIHGHPR
jgi:hypothetical protein